MLLALHWYAIPNAVAARCAGEQGRYRERREPVASRPEDLPQAPSDDLAHRVGLDLAAVDECREFGLQERKVREDAASARAAGISATPTFVPGRTTEGSVSATIGGAEPLAVFRQTINSLRQRKKSDSPGAWATTLRRNPRALRPRAPSAARHASA